MEVSNHFSLQSAAAHFEQHGYVIVDAEIAYKRILNIFTDRYLAKFSDDAGKNRNLLKVFANDIVLKDLIVNLKVMSFLRYIQTYPVMTGPLVTHWTSTDITGDHYALPFHQDWPSMGTSSNSVICWTSLHDVNQNTHGLSVIPGSHKQGLVKGIQTENGYLVEAPDEQLATRLDVNAGQVLFM